MTFDFFFFKSLSRIFQVSLKSSKNNGYFTRRSMNIYDVIRQGADYIHVTVGRDTWRALVNAVMNLRFNKILEIS